MSVLQNTLNGNGLHTVEFYAAGTAVRRTGSGETITPSFVMPMSM